MDSIDIPIGRLCHAAGRFRRQLWSDVAAVGDRLRSIRPHGCGCEDQGGFATRPGWRFRLRSKRGRLRVDAVAGRHHANGLDKHLACGWARCDFLLAKFTDVVRFARDSGSFWVGEPVGVGAADTGGAQSDFGRRLERRRSREGFLIPRPEKCPPTASGSSYDRQAGPGEASRQPGYGTHMAWTRNVFGQPLRVGAGGYYSRQDYGFNRNVDGWAGMTDFELPLSPQFSLSGEFYRGRAIGGLYGAFGQSILFNGDPTLCRHGSATVGRRLVAGPN